MNTGCDENKKRWTTIKTRKIILDEDCQASLISGRKTNQAFDKWDLIQSAHWND